MISHPNTYVVGPKESHSSTIILLHGRGSNGQEFAEELFEAQASDGHTLRDLLPGMKWVFPTARERFSTVFQEPMTEWFDIISLTDPEERQNLQVQGLSESVTYILSLVDEELKFVGGNPTKLVFGGIGQGCAVAIHALLAGEIRLGAFIGFCAWLPFRSQLDILADSIACQKIERGIQKGLREFYESSFQLKPFMNTKLCSNDSVPARGESMSSLNTPLFLSHCKDDNMVDVELGRQFCDVLRRMGISITWDEHEKGGHWVNEPDGIDHLLAFIKLHQSTTIMAKISSQP